MFGRRRRRDPAGAAGTGPSAAPVPAAAPLEPLDDLLVRTVARHFPGARVDGRDVQLGVGGLVIDCTVAGVQDFGEHRAASLYLHVRGGALGPRPAFASISGYGPSDEAAVAEGACLWACSFGPVLRVALGGPGPAEHEPDDAEEVEQFEALHAGRRWRVVVGELGRVVGADDPDREPAEVLAAARHRLAGPATLTEVVLGSGTLPLLTRPSLLSVFVMDAPGRRTVEVKVDGRDWLASNAAFDGGDPQPEGSMALLRELAVLVPLEPAAAIDRAALEATLAAFDPDVAGPGDPDGWPGWWAHGGRLAAALAPEALAELEAGTGPLPHRQFLLATAGAGAGPGYGLLPPARDGEVLPLAEAGCGIRWVLRLDAAHAGEVWVDARATDGGYRPVAATFTDWYGDWLDAALHGGAWVQWDAGACATPALIAAAVADGASLDLRRRFGAGSIEVPAPTGRAPVGPCHACVEHVSRFGLPPEVFAVPGGGGPDSGGRAGGGAA